MEPTPPDLFMSLRPVDNSVEPERSQTGDRKPCVRSHVIVDLREPFDGQADERRASTAEVQGSIEFPMCCHSVACGIASQTQSPTQKGSWSDFDDCHHEQFLLLFPSKSLSRAIHPMNEKGRTIKSILALLMLVFLSSCATAGKSITQAKVNEIRPGQTTEEDLVRTFGSPTTRTVDPKGETSLNWFYSSPISAQNYIPIVGPALGGMKVKVCQLWVVLGVNGKVKRYIVY